MTDLPNGTPPRLLIADDDTVYREWLRHHLDVIYPDAAITLLGVDELAAQAETLSENDWDIVLLAACFGSTPEDPRAVGLELLRKLRGRPNLPGLIAIAEEGNELTAVRAVQLGAADYLPKRLLTPDRLRTSTHLILRKIGKRRPQAGGTESRQSAQGQAPSSLAPEALAPPPDPDPLLWRDKADAPPLSESTTPGAPPPGAMEPVIPGFRIKARIGDSETATVYLAESDSLVGRTVALKVSKTVRDEIAGRQLLEREYTAITAIYSPSIVTIYDYGVHEGHEYLAMEYLPRGDLKHRMQKGLTEDEALHYAHCVASALKVVHAAGIVHRDLKPPNVLLRDNDDVALIDFGLSRPASTSATSTSVSVVRGSPYYMSPEHALGENLDPRTDFYSLGVMLYEMLTGRKPYHGSTALEVLQQHVSAPLPQLPPAQSRYQRILDRLLAKDREDRFASAEDILSALAELKTLSPPTETSNNTTLFQMMEELREQG